MIRFWIEFNINECLPIGTDKGCGVSAHDRKDALGLVRERVFAGMALPSINVLTENVDISELDERHVLANMGDVTVRGVWFPLGYN